MAFLFSWLCRISRWHEQDGYHRQLARLEEVLKQGRIFDEYGKEWPYTEFVEMVEKTGEPGYLNHYDEGSKHYRHCYNDFDSENWKDSEGWSFSTTEFC